MRNFLLSILISLPFAINAQESGGNTFAFTTIAAQDNGSSIEFQDNYTKGADLYNKGVDIINKLSLSSTIDETNKAKIQANAQFKMALPFLEKAYNLNPKNENILKALQGAYFSFNDIKDSDRYKKELESLKK